MNFRKSIKNSYKFVWVFYNSIFSSPILELTWGLTTESMVIWFSVIIIFSAIHHNGSGPYLFTQIVHFINQHIINKYKFAKGTIINSAIHGFLSKSLNLLMYDIITIYTFISINKFDKIAIEFNMFAHKKFKKKPNRKVNISINK